MMTHQQAGIIGLCLLAAGGLSAWATSLATAAACDATTGASCVVVGVKTTTTSATLSWTEKRHSSSRTFCYGIGTPSKCAEVSSRASGVKNQVVTGLTANTKYAYKFYGTYRGAVKSTITGTFVTDGSGCGTSLITTVELDGNVLSASGDSLESVVVVATNKTSGAVVARDTTDRSGYFNFALDPGTYLIACTLPPFTSPTPYSATVVASKPLTIPDQILKDAFLIGGTVVNSGSPTPLEGATVTVTRKSDKSQVAVRLTDSEGHFSVGLTAGDYQIDATFGGKAMVPALSLTVTKSVELPNLTISAVSGIQPANFRNSGFEAGKPDRVYDIKGARLPDNGSSRKPPVWILSM